jgi:hypothetical protein
MDNIKIKEFIKKYKISDKGMLKILNDIGYVFENNLIIGEIAINEGFVWLEKYNIWIDKNNPNYTNKDKEIYEFLYNEKFNN